MIRKSILLLFPWAVFAALAFAEERDVAQTTFTAQPIPPQIGDLYLTDVAAGVINLEDGQSAIYIRQRADQKIRSIKQSLWRVDAESGPRAMEPGEPDAFSPLLSPDGKWIAFLSTRPFPDGTPAFTPVPPYSDPAADIWLIPTTGGKAIPLAGPGKPHGRVITDTFYGRVSFSPDGKRLLFVADERKDLRTQEERRNNVIIVREDQGEGYEGYGPTQVWVADLLDSPQDVAAKTITKLTPGDYWYGDPQWSPDGAFVVVQANRNPEQESARYSINHNYDLWRVSLSDRKLKQLTFGPGPEFSPRISPDGQRLVCLSSPRRGPHRDVYNLVIVELTEHGPKSRVLFDHHAKYEASPPHLSPEYPLPENCWLDKRRVMFDSSHGVKTVKQVVDLDAGPEALDKDPSPAPKRSPLIPSNSPLIGKRLRAEDQILRWNSFDGLEIEGILTTPPESVAQAPYKLLVMPHGGPHHRATSGSGFDVQFFATRGFAVFQPNFRGSTGYGLKFLDADRNDFGGGDMKDILTGIDHLVKEGIADPKRQFVYGISYGGYMTSWLVGQTHQFRAAVAQNAVTDLNVMWHLSDLQSWTEHDMSGFPWEVPERMRKHSPLTYAHKVKTPTLILHATNDRRCPVAMGKMFHRALKESGVETQMVLYPDEGHPIKQLPHREDVLLRVLDWFETHDIPANEDVKPGVSTSLQEYQSIKDIQYAEVEGHRLLLDLYLPANQQNLPLIVWVHGGAWRKGSKSQMPLIELVKSGFAVASVEYRLSPVARFPAQIHDLKAAIRFLRASEAKWSINAKSIAVAGTSAGGHLAALLGVTNDHKELEGRVGDHLDQSSAVQAIVDYYGPTNFLTILSQSTPHGLSVRVPALELLLGGPPDKQSDLARLASPVFHVDLKDPPLLLIHGDQDPQVPINQAHELHGKYKVTKLPVQFEVVHGGAHGGDAFFDDERNAIVQAFLTKHLRASEGQADPKK